MIFPAISQSQYLYDDGVRVFVVLDFDGVINALSKNSKSIEGFGNWQTFWQPLYSDGWQRKYLLTWSPEMIAGLNVLFLDQRVQLCWLTSWQEMVREPTKRMGLATESKRPPVIIDYRKKPFDDQIGKLDGLTSYFESIPEDASLIWVDDCLLAENGDYASLVDDCCSQLSFGHRLTIGPNPLHGISPKELQQISDFIRAHGGDDDRPRGDGKGPQG